MGLFSSLFGGSSSKPEDLGFDYVDAMEDSDTERMEEIEEQMYEDHGYTFHHGMWQDDEKPSLWSKLFG